MNNDNKVLFGKPNQSIQFVEFVNEIDNQNNCGCKDTVEPFIVSHGMTFHHICPCTDPKKIANGPRAIGEVTDGFPKRLLGGADSLGIHYKDSHPVLSQKQVSFVDYSRVPKYNYPIPEVRL